MRPAPKLYIVIPCYNEQEVLPLSMPILTDILQGMIARGEVDPDSHILLCNDGSSDRTWEIITELHSSNPLVYGLNLAYNSGQQNAILAGLEAARQRCDAAVVIDSDLQDDPYKIPEMVRLYREGKDVVYGVRSSRQTDTFFKRTTARGFYRFQQLMGLDTVYDHAEYRLMSKHCLDILSRYDERTLFIRGIVPSIGLPSAVVTYPRTVRLAGETKYSFKRLIDLSIDGITSFTARPMRIIFLIGLALMLICIPVAIWVLVSYSGDIAVSGWSSLMLSIWFLGSMMLMAIGIVGEYIGKIYIEVKHRPRYVVETELF